MAAKTKRIERDYEAEFKETLERWRKKDLPKHEAVSGIVNELEGSGDKDMIIWLTSPSLASVVDTLFYKYTLQISTQAIRVVRGFNSPNVEVLPSRRTAVPERSRLLKSPTYIALSIKDIVVGNKPLKLWCAEELYAHGRFLIRQGEATATRGRIMCSIAEARGLEGSIGDLKDKDIKAAICAVTGTDSIPPEFSGKS